MIAPPPDRYSRVARCGRSTKKGTPCLGFPVHVGWGCSKHLTEDERQEHEKRRAAADAFWDRALALPAEPACWSWTPPRTIAEIRAEMEAATGDDRLSPSTIDRILADEDAARLDDFHRGRCAICGCAGHGRLVDDHDHKTGLRRGYLCRSCNTREGFSDDEPFTGYRLRHPAAILGVEIVYWSPLDGYAEPAVPPTDRWKDNPMTNVGL